MVDTHIPENARKLMKHMNKNIPSITENQMKFMSSQKEPEIITVNGITAEIRPYMFPPVSQYSYSTRVLLDNMQFQKNERVLEIGTGCGILSVFAAKQGARVDGVDILPECAQYSLANAIRNGVFVKTRFFYSNMFSNVDSTYDSIICNLPILNGELPENDPRWYSLFDPGFKFHKQLFSEGRHKSKRIFMAHADLCEKGDFEDLEELADSFGWYTEDIKSAQYAEHEWRSYEFKYTGSVKR
jgi:release factor glutamine methyltransferase